MKRDSIDFQTEAPRRLSEQAGPLPAESEFTQPRYSIESLAYGAVMVAMFIAILSFMVLLIIGF